MDKMMKNEKLGGRVGSYKKINNGYFIIKKKIFKIKILIDRFNSSLDVMVYKISKFEINKKY